MRLVAAVVVALTVPFVAQNPPSEARFEVVSIKRNTTNKFVPGPDGLGQYWMSNGTAADMILRGYPTDTAPPEIVNVPEWAKSLRYDILAKGKPRATNDEQQQMWRALLEDRLKLQAHYERRERSGYRLVFARNDQRLGPGLTMSAMDCRGQQPFPSAAALGAAGSDEQFARQRCGFMMVRTETGATSVSGGASMASIARLLAGFVQRPVIDGTGLAGNYAVTFTHAPGSSSNGGAGPSVFVAVEEQLGLKLQAATIAVQAVVIDHIEKPSDN